jgi:hypothetical protein
MISKQILVPFGLGNLSTTTCHPGTMADTCSSLRSRTTGKMLVGGKKAAWSGVGHGLKFRPGWPCMLCFTPREQEEGRAGSQAVAMASGRQLAGTALTD